jgi:hypothetical protein
MPADLSLRIKNIQKFIGVPQTGVIDILTCQNLEQRLRINVNSANLSTHIKAVQRGLGAGDDGIVGPMTLSRIEAFISPKLPAIPAGASLVVSKKGVEVIINAEVSSPATYDVKYQRPVWPKGESGVTIGIGYDLGQCTKAEFTKDWGAVLSQKDMNTLMSTVGLKGTKAQAAIAGCQSVKIPFAKAAAVFYQSTLPIYAGRTRSTYKGLEKLPPDAQGALLSLVYNRGGAINDSDGRKEMKALVPLVAAGDLKGIAVQLRSMKRLWPTLPGLIARREKEAMLVENASFNLVPEEMVVV